MEMLEMAPSREAVPMVCYVLPMGNAWVCIEYLFIVIFSDEIFKKKFKPNFNIHITHIHFEDDRYDCRVYY